MKKLLLSLFFVCTSFLLFAQEGDTFKGFKLGLTAHPNFGYLKSDIQDVKSNGLRAGFTYGLIGDFAFAENYTFSTGLKLSTINGQTQTKNSTLDYQTIYKLQYIEIPLEIKLFTNQKQGIRYFGEFGLGNAINVKARQDVKPSDNLTPAQSNQDINKDIDSYRGSIIIGGGAEFALGGKTKMSTGLTFDNGFTNIKSNGTGKLKNSYLGLNIAVFF
jgi:hypothetical protein